MGKRKALPGQIHTFKDSKTGEEHTGVLPSKLGESNKFAIWDGLTWKSRKFVNRRQRERQNRVGSKERVFQKPGQTWTFRYAATGEEDFGILPLALGESNDFAFWHNRCWVSRKFLNRSRIITGEVGNLNLLLRFKCTLSRVKNRAEERNHAPCLSTANDLLELWNKQKGNCAACGESIDIFKSVFDHNHETEKREVLSIIIAIQRKDTCLDYHRMLLRSTFYGLEKFKARVSNA